MYVLLPLPPPPVSPCPHHQYTCIHVPACLHKSPKTRQDPPPPHPLRLCVHPLNPPAPNLFLIGQSCQRWYNTHQPQSLGPSPFLQTPVKVCFTYLQNKTKRLLEQVYDDNGEEKGVRRPGVADVWVPGAISVPSLQEPSVCHHSRSHQCAITPGAISVPSLQEPSVCHHSRSHQCAITPGAISVPSLQEPSVCHHSRSHQCAITPGAISVPSLTELCFTRHIPHLTFLTYGYHTTTGITSKRYEQQLFTYSISFRTPQT